jgi:hypothetical protein
MSRDLEANLLAHRFPVAVVYGPERLTREAVHGRPTIVVERDTEQSDSLSHVAVRGNARKLFVRELAVRARVYAQSSLPGAHAHDHEDLCEKIVDAFLVALYQWGVEGKAGAIPITEAKYIPPPEGFEQFPGVVYSIRFRVPRSVDERTFAGETAAGAARPTGTIAGIANRTDVTYAHSDDDPSVGCGA